MPFEITEVVATTFFYPREFRFRITLIRPLGRCNQTVFEDVVIPFEMMEDVCGMNPRQSAVLHLLTGHIRDVIGERYPEDRAVVWADNIVWTHREDFGAYARGAPKPPVYDPELAPVSITRDIKKISERKRIAKIIDRNVTRARASEVRHSRRALDV